MTEDLFSLLESFDRKGALFRRCTGDGQSATVSTNADGVAALRDVMVTIGGLGGRPHPWQHDDRERAVI